jgi:GNAT superfamily N-acetyltransferase
MEIEITRAEESVIKGLRKSFLQENDFQFVHDKCHYYGWAESYLFRMGSEVAGYGALWGFNERENRDCIFEYYLLEPFRGKSQWILSRFISQTGANFLECQTNDRFWLPLFSEFAQKIQGEAILFKDRKETSFRIPGAEWQKGIEEPGDVAHNKKFVLVVEGKEVATGGFLLNYNLPYADIYYDVGEAFRRKGYGSLMVQELKKEAYAMGRVPAARCNVNNWISKATLVKGGFSVCGYLLAGETKKGGKRTFHFPLSISIF